MRTTRYGYGTAYSTHSTWLVACVHDGPNDVSCLSREKEEELRLSTRYSAMDRSTDSTTDRSTVGTY